MKPVQVALSIILALPVSLSLLLDATLATGGRLRGDVQTAIWLAAWAGSAIIAARAPSTARALGRLAAVMAVASFAAPAAFWLGYLTPLSPHEAGEPVEALGLAFVGAIVFAYVLILGAVGGVISTAVALALLRPWSRSRKPR